MRHTAPLPTDTEREADAFLAAVLRNEAPIAPARPDLLPERALYHGVTAFLATKSDAIAGLPEGIRGTIRNQALAEAMWDVRHRQLLVSLLDALEKAGAGPVLLKGAALAYSLYAAPALRPRGDSDILVRADRRQIVNAILEEQGFTRGLDINTDAPHEAVRQEAWSRLMPDGSTHNVDLHWQVTSAWSLAHVFAYEDILREARPVPSLGPAARMMSIRDAFHHACIHRALHVDSPYIVGDKVYYGGDRLIWLHDMRLLLSHMTEMDIQRLVAACRAGGTAAICLDALTHVRDLLGVPVPATLIAGLEAATPRGGAKSPHTPVPQWRRVLTELAAIPDFRTRRAFLRRLLFPSAEFMRARYPELANRPVSFLHFKRISDALLFRRGKGSR